MTPEVAVAVGESDHEVEKNRALAAALVGSALPPAEPRLLLDDATRDRARAHLRSLGLAPGRFVLGCPGGTANNACKGWPSEPYAAVAVHLHERHGLPVLLTGLPGEAERMDEVARRAADHDVPVARHVGDGSDLPLLLGLIAESRLYLGADTGPMHFAGALDVPVVALFGGGHWPRFLPRARRSFVATQELPCFRCHWDCFLAEPACLTAVSTEAMTRGVDWILGDGPDERRVDRGHAVEPELAQVLLSARARHDAGHGGAGRARAAAPAFRAAGGRAARPRDTARAGLADARRPPPRERAGQPAATAQHGGAAADRRRARSEIDEQRHEIESTTVDEQRRELAEQQAVLARRSVRIARRLKLP